MPPAPANLAPERDAAEPLRRHILVVDDDARIRELLKQYLVSHGYRATAAGDAAEAARCMSLTRFDLLIVDVMMPGESGLELTARLRRENGAGAAIPILMLTAQAETEQRIAGLEHGASDYLGKPFAPRELLLRARNLLERKPNAAAPAVRAVSFGRFRFDVAAGRLYKEGRPMSLTTAEETLLAAFAAAPGRVFSRAEIVALGDGELESSIDVRINRLRRKIEENPRAPLHLQTVRGRGYVLRPDEIFTADEAPGEAEAAS